jgi:hypothetical protein
MRDVRRVVYQLEPEFVWESCYISWARLHIPHMRFSYPNESTDHGSLNMRKIYYEVRLLSIYMVQH